jgi:hypothetical protein
MASFPANPWFPERASPTAYQADSLEPSNPYSVPIDGGKGSLYNRRFGRFGKIRRDREEGLCRVAPTEVSIKYRFMNKAGNHGPRRCSQYRTFI